MLRRPLHPLSSLLAALVAPILAVLGAALIAPASLAEAQRSDPPSASRLWQFAQTQGAWFMRGDAGLFVCWHPPATPGPSDCFVRIDLGDEASDFDGAWFVGTRGGGVELDLDGRRVSLAPGAHRVGEAPRELEAREGDGTGEEAEFELEDESRPAADPSAPEQLGFVPFVDAPCTSRGALASEALVPVAVEHPGRVEFAARPCPRELGCAGAPLSRARTRRPRWLEARLSLEWQLRRAESRRREIWPGESPTRRSESYDQAGLLRVSLAFDPVAAAIARRELAVPPPAPAPAPLPKTGAKTDPDALFAAREALALADARCGRLAAPLQRGGAR